MPIPSIPSGCHQKQRNAPINQTKQRPARSSSSAPCPSFLKYCPSFLKYCPCKRIFSPRIPSLLTSPPLWPTLHELPQSPSMTYNVGKCILPILPSHSYPVQIHAPIQCQMPNTQIWKRNPAPASPNITHESTESSKTGSEIYINKRLSYYYSTTPQEDSRKSPTRPPHTVLVVGVTNRRDEITQR